MMAMLTVEPAEKSIPAVDLNTAQPEVFEISVRSWLLNVRVVVTFSASTLLAGSVASLRHKVSSKLGLRVTVCSCN